jgi:hypothetical protein
LTNTTGATADDLGVYIADFASAGPGGNGVVTSQSPFPAADNSFDSFPPDGAIVFSGATVDSGSTASFTVTQTVLYSYFTPVLTEYQWSSGLNGLGDIQYPLGLGIYSPDPSDPTTEVEIGDDDIVDHDYENLNVSQNGQSLLAIPSSGDLPAAFVGEPITAVFNLDAGTLSFGLTDDTAGFSLSGTFTPGPGPSPEPATWGVCGMLLLAMGVTIWRRRIVAR